MHVIRLRQPWQTRELPGGVRYRRAFHRPTGLDGGQRVWLVIESPQSQVAVWLNGERLGDVRQGTAGRFNVTGRLADRNRLEIDVERGTADSPVGEVRLEIG
jgi:hypothetical protein